MNDIKALFDCVYKLLNVNFVLLGYNLSFLVVIIFMFLVSTLIWFIGRVLK